MTDKKKYYKLDDVGVVGKQEKGGSFSYHAKKTGDVIRQRQESRTHTVPKWPKRKAS